MPRHSLPQALALTALLTLALAACGNRGPLYLPGPGETGTTNGAEPAQGEDGFEDGKEDEDDEGDA